MGQERPTVLKRVVGGGLAKEVGRPGGGEGGSQLESYRWWGELVQRPRGRTVPGVAGRVAGAECELLLPGGPV